MGAFRSKGPQTPSRVDGSPLDRLLRAGKAPLDDGLELTDFIIDKQTAGTICELYWQYENSILKHEYLVLSVVIPNESEPSWVRLERMGELGKEAKRKASNSRASFLFTLAPTMADLVHSSDQSHQQVYFPCDSGPSLVDMANFVRIIHEEAPDYSFPHENCWWLARQLFQIMVENFHQEGKRKQRLSSYCFHRELKHSLASRRSGPRLALYVASGPLAPVTMVAVWSTTLYLSLRASHVLKEYDKRIRARVERYLRKTWKT